MIGNKIGKWQRPVHSGGCKLVTDDELRLFIQAGNFSYIGHCPNEIGCPDGDIDCYNCAGDKNNHKEVLRYIKKTNIKKLNRHSVLRVIYERARLSIRKILR